ncbi:MAG: alpha/beta hydrolase, partial [Alphaproteobacteria bacterium]|nr:alpha/beta hydrolase [Alphaproteobacteria bacterium]
MFDYIIERVKANENTLLQSYFAPLSVKIEVDMTSFQLLLQSGNIEFSSKLTEKNYDFTLSASKNSWLELKKITPKPGFQCLSTMRRTQNLIVTGDILKFHQHLLLLEMLFSNIVQSENAYETGTLPRIEKIKGQYLHLDIDDIPHRLYFEEAGNGIPLVCLHTAGSDSRQYQHLLNDPSITQNFRVITFDLPWHGKSSPPHGFEKNVYQLTTESYLSIIVSFLKALGIENSIVIGCSIG